MVSAGARPPSDPEQDSWIFMMTESHVDIRVGDVVRLKKRHPCGGWEWRVVRTGADIGLVCTTCGRRLMLPRDKFRRSLKRIVARASHQSADS